MLVDVVSQSTGKDSKTMDKLETRVIQVSNVAPTCTKEQLRMLFSYLGRIKDLQMFPPETIDASVVTARVAYVEFEDATTTGVSLHLSNTVFVDRALMIVPVMDGRIPDESNALQLTPQAVAGMLPGQPTWPANVVTQMTGTGNNQVITTNDPRLTSLGLPQYPPLPPSTDTSIVEEIRRTLYVSDLDPKVTGDMLLKFFAQVGEIKYIRMAGNDNLKAAYIEFTDQRCIAQGLTFNKVVFAGRQISIQHSETNIVKPHSKSEATQREMDEAMRKVKEAQKLISAAASDPKKDRSSRSASRRRSRSRGGRSRSRSRSRRRSRSRSRRRTRRSRSRSRRRSRSRHRSPRRSRSPRRRRSRSRGKAAPPAPSSRRSRSRDRRRSRTRSPVRRRRSRSVSRPRRKSRTPPRSYSKRSRSRSRNRRSRSRSRRRSRSRDRKNKDKKKSTSLSPPRLERNGSIPSKDEEKTSSEESKKEKKRQQDWSQSKMPKRKEKPIDDTTSQILALTKEVETKENRPRSRSPSPYKSRRKSPSPRRRSRSRSRDRDRSPSLHKSRRKSPSPRRRSRSRSRDRDRKSKRRRRTRSPSPERRRRSRTRSGSRHRSRRERSKRDRSRDRSRDRDRDRDRKHDKKKSRSDRDKDRDRDRDRKREDKEEKTSSSSKIKRDYDEEEKGFASGSERERETSVVKEVSEKREDKPPPSPPIVDSSPIERSPVGRSRSPSTSPPQLSMEKDTDIQPVDMDMSD